MKEELVLLTGGTGFVGQGFSNSITKEAFPCRLRKAIRKPTGVPLHGATEEHAVVGDISDHTDWAAALKNVSVVVHLAGKAHSRSSGRNAKEFFRVNTQGTLSLANQAFAAGVRRFVFVSTIGVHGEESSTPITEKSPIKARLAYAASKWEAENLLLDLSEKTGMEVVIVRPPLVHGPNAPGNFGSLVRLVRSGMPLPLGGLGNRRSLVGLQNLADFLWHCTFHPAAAGETFVVSDGEQISTTEIIRRIIHACGCKNRLFAAPKSLLRSFSSLPVVGAKLRKMISDLPVDCTKASRVLGWSPPATGVSAYAPLGENPTE